MIRSDNSAAVSSNNDDRYLPQISPETRRRQTEVSISPIELRPFDISVENDKPLAKRKDFIG